MSTIPTASTFTYKGETLRIEPLSTRAIVEHAKHLREQYMEEAKKQMAGLPLELSKHAWDQAKAHADRIQPGTGEYDAEAQRLESQIYLLWLSLLKNHPKFTLDDARAAMEEKYEELSRKASEAAGFSEPAKATEPALAAT